MLAGRCLIEPFDFTIAEMEELFRLGDRIIEEPQKYAHICEGKILATLFYEPSTRTRLSFETAMLRLGGKVIGFASPDSSSVSKGETISDTATIVSAYADVIAMRHSVEGAPKVAAMAASVPVINAGDGGHQHPTQTLADMMTIHREKGTFDGLVVGMCGDLKYGRTVHSLLKALSRYQRVHFVFIAPKELEMPRDLIEEMIGSGTLSYEVTVSMEEAMPKLDILYMTRVQKERFDNEEEYQRLKDAYILNTEKMALGKPELMVLHPLPRVNEITVEVDEDPRALYFKQAEYGMYIRMALIVSLLGLEPGVEHFEKTPKLPLFCGKGQGRILMKERHCCNPKCVTAKEPEIKQILRLMDEEKQIYACEYCDTATRL